MAAAHPSPMEELERLRESIKLLLVEGRDERLSDVVDDAHPADVSRVIRELQRDDQVRLFRLLSPQHAGEVLAELDDPTLRELVSSLPEVEVSRVLDRMSPEQVVDVVEELPKKRADDILELMEEEKSRRFDSSSMGRNTAGRLMSSVRRGPRGHDRRRGIEHIRKAASARALPVRGRRHDPGRRRPLHRLLAADAAAPIRALRTDEVESVRADTDQEEVARLVQHYNLIQIPVVDVNRRLLGTIGVDGVIDVMREEATEDIQRLGGVAGDETVLDPPRAVFVKRNLWRLINLGTAVLAASVIGLFESSIQTLATLAVFMPIVASMGGIATTQTATVVVRGIALGDMSSSVLRRVLWKELWLGLSTGGVNGLVIAVIAYVWKGQLLLSLILAVALVANMLVAAVVGTLIPIALKTSRVDPAIASSVIITTFTDVFGFFSFLGLATLLIRFLL